MKITRNILLTYRQEILLLDDAIIEQLEEERYANPFISSSLHLVSISSLHLPNLFFVCLFWLQKRNSWSWPVYMQALSNSICKHCVLHVFALCICKQFLVQHLSMLFWLLLLLLLLRPVAPCLLLLARCSCSALAHVVVVVAAGCSLLVAACSVVVACCFLFVACGLFLVVLALSLL